ncbi:MAG: Rpn family recombination-promoting nuclease/putative transposase [Myxococcota bacterium]
MTKPNPTPHDTIHKVSFRSPRIHLPFLRKNLPEGLRDKFDPETVEVISESFPADHPLRAADVVLRMKLFGDLGWLYVIIEGQSAPDPNMGFRLLFDRIEVLKHHLQSEAGRHSRVPPIILSFVVYTGAKSWRRPELDVFARLDPALRELARTSLLGGAHFVNMRQVDARTLEDSPALQAFAIVTQGAYETDKIGVLAKAEPALTRVYGTPGGAALCEAMVKYTLRSGGTSSAEDVRMVVKELNNRLHGVVRSETMSIADILTQAGLKRGLEKGLEKGKLERSMEIARNLLAAGIDLKLIAGATGLSRQKLVALRRK